MSRDPDPCTRDGAKVAGWRYAATYPGEVLVLQHAGTSIGRWRLKTNTLEHGGAVASFKHLRETLHYGGLALWHQGHVTRYEQGEQCLTGKTGSARTPTEDEREWDDGCMGGRDQHER